MEDAVKPILYLVGFLFVIAGLAYFDSYRDQEVIFMVRCLEDRPENECEWRWHAHRRNP